MAQSVCLKHDETKQGIISVVNSNIRFYTFRQGKEMTCDEYLILFRAQVDTINAHGGRTGVHWGTYLGKLKMILSRDELVEHPSSDEMEKAQQEASDLVCTEYL